MPDRLGTSSPTCRAWPPSCRAGSSRCSCPARRAAGRSNGGHDALRPRPALARPRHVLRVLPRRHRQGTRRRPPDGLDGPRRQAHPPERLDAGVTRLESTPRADGFHMPPEWAPHEGCWMLWPHRSDTWRDGGAPAQAAFAAVAGAIAASEHVWMGVAPALCAAAAAALGDSIEVVPMPSDDASMRDVGPTFVVDDGGRPTWDRLGVQRVGRALRPVGPGRRGRRAGARSPRRHGLPGASRARRWIDRRRRRRHRAHHRAMPAEPEPQLVTVASRDRARLPRPSRDRAR